MNNKDKLLLVKAAGLPSEFVGAGVSDVLMRILGGGVGYGIGASGGGDYYSKLQGTRLGQVLGSGIPNAAAAIAAAANKTRTRDEQIEAEDKYSYVASLDEIIENDYNLNIPRYVDTFEEEEPVDLDAVSSELKGLETELQETNDTIEDFCKQLNIKTPF